MVKRAVGAEPTSPIRKKYWMVEPGVSSPSGKILVYSTVC